MSYSLVIIGVGNLGKRNLDGITCCSLPMEIWLCDSSPQVIYEASRLESVKKLKDNGNPVLTTTQIKDLPAKVDLCIVTTTADVRSGVCQELAENCTPNYWILEKFLSQSESGLRTIEFCTQQAIRAWVNLPRRAMTWHRKIGKHLQNSGPLKMRVSGGRWGIACNAIHFLDLCAFWSTEEVVSINNRGLHLEWIPSKRFGFSEITGTLDIQFSRGSSLRLECHDDDSPLVITIEKDSFIWCMNEREGVAIRSDGITFNGNLELQSELMGPLVESILTTGECLLPDLRTAMPPHRELLRSFLEHWNKSRNGQDKILPIT